MAKLKADELRKRLKEDVFVDGYFIATASELTPGIDSTQESIDVMGQDDPVTSMTIDNGTLSMTVQDKRGDYNLQCLLTNQDPGATGSKKFYYNEVTPVTVWANLKDATNTKYVQSFFYNQWLPTPGLPTGAAGDKSTRAFSGQCAIPQEFNQPILSECLALAANATGSLGKLVALIPGTTDIYAIKILAINDTSGYKTQEVTVSAAMVSSTGVVTANAVIAALDTTIFATTTKIFVIYLVDSGAGGGTPVTGVYPTLQDTLTGDGKMRS